MKRILIMLAASMLLCVNAAYPADYYLTGFVFAANGDSGTASTENSFATAHIYRAGINNQIGTLDSPGIIYPAGGGFAAFYNTDVGTIDWAVTQPALGQTMTAVVEVYAPLFGWAGDSYIACTRAVIADLVHTQLDDVQLKAIPTPRIDSITAGQIVLSLVGMDVNYINSYGLYRSTTPAGSYTLVTVVAQDRGVSIPYADTSIAAGQDYYYKWNVNFDWGGGGGAPAYYSSTAMSLASGPAAAPTMTSTDTASPSATDTPVNTLTGTPTFTETATGSPTMTGTPTATGTGTNTMTVTATFTASDTSTATGTPSATETGTESPTQTATPTLTETGTATKTGTPSGTATDTFTSSDTPTVTETVTDSPTQTETMTATDTDTPTVTPTVSETVTVSPTDTCTPSSTETGTDTITATITETITDTYTATATPTITATSTITVTPAITDTPTPPVVYEPIAYPQPASNTITFAYKLTTSTQVTIFVYNLIGSQVAVFGPYAYAGSPGIYSSPQAPPVDISKFAPGVYFYLVKTNKPADKFNVQKFLVER